MSNARPVEAITQAIIGQLAKIKRANGYANDVRRIFRMDLLEDQITDGMLPALFVVEDPEGEKWEFQDGASYRSRLPFIIGGAVKEESSDLLAQDRVVRINSLENDARKALLQDPKFGGTVHDSALHGKVPFVSPDSAFAVFALDMYVTYYFTKETL